MLVIIIQGLPEHCRHEIQCEVHSLLKCNASLCTLPILDGWTNMHTPSCANPAKWRLN